MKEVTLKSGRKLRLQAADFRKSKDLFDAISKEIKGNEFDPKAEFDINFIKNILLGMVSSPQVEATLWPCFTGCLYKGDTKVTPDLFEDMSAREDFLEICFEVAKINVLPFTKNLSSKFEPILKDMGLTLT